MRGYTALKRWRLTHNLLKDKLDEKGDLLMVCIDNPGKNIMVKNNIEGHAEIDRYRFKNPDCHCKLYLVAYGSRKARKMAAPKGNQFEKVFGG